MKLERSVSRLQPVHAAEALGFEPERSEMGFDPSRDFNPLVKARVIEEVAQRLEQEYKIEIDEAWFFHLFPEEFRQFAKDKGLKRALYEDVLRGKQPPPKGPSQWVSVLPRDVYKASTVFLFLYPGKLKDLDLQNTVSSELQEWVRETREAERFAQALFYRKLLFPRFSPSPKEAEEAWSKAQSWIADEDPWIHTLATTLAHLRLSFPEKPPPQLSEAQWRELREDLSLSVKALIQDPSRTSALEQYTTLAWAATILSAETVRILPEGRIEFEMPKKSITIKPQLPERTTI